MKKLSYLLIVVACLSGNNLLSQVAINTNGTEPHSSAMLEITSDSRGLLIPRMTESQKGNISPIETGLLIYQTDGISGFYYYNGSSWNIIGAGVEDINDLSDGISDGNSVFLGSGAGAIDNGSNANTVLGINALNLNTSGSGNVAIGFDALENNTDHVNVGVGYQSLNFNTSGGYNVGIGAGANMYNQTGSNNVIVGYEAGYGSSTHNKSGCVFLGYNAGYNEEASNKLYIDNSNTSYPLIYGDFYNNLLKINGTLELSNGTSASSIKFYEPSGSGTDYTLFQSQAQSGNVTYTLPVADGSSGQVLQTDGSGSLSWSDDVGVTDINGLSDGKTGNYSTFLGQLAGNSNSGNYNVGVGYRSSYLNSHGDNNSAIGYHSLYSNISGDRNTAIGYKSLYNTNNHSNTAVGSSSLYYNTYGAYNIANGINALYMNTLGNANVAVGVWALYSNTIGSDNIALGKNSLYNNKANSRSTSIGFQAMRYADDRTTNERDTYNTAIGYESLYGSTTASANTGQYNTAVGDQTLYSNTSGNSNIAIGISSLYNNKANSHSIAIGYQAMYYADERTTGGRNTYNTAIGYEALRGSTIAGNNTGFFNIAMGMESLHINTAGSYNVAIGNNVLEDNTSGNSNTAMGDHSGQNCSTGYSNTFIGASASTSNGSINNATAIGSGSYVVSNNSVLLGNTSVTWIGGHSTWNNTSDERMKNNIKEDVSGLDFILKLRPVTYNFDKDKMDNLIGTVDSSDYPEKYDIEKIKQSGFLAQEVEQAAKNAGYDFSGVSIPKGNGKYYSLAYAEFVVPLVKAVQELKKENNELTLKVTELETLKLELEELKAQVAQIIDK